RELEKLSLMQVELVRQRVGFSGEPREFEPTRRFALRGSAVKHRPAEHGRERDVIPDRERAKRPRNLISAGDAGARDPVRGNAAASCGRERVARTSVMLLRSRQRPRIPCGMNRITRISTTPTTALPAIA